MDTRKTLYEEIKEEAKTTEKEESQQERRKDIGTGHIKYSLA